MELDKDSNNQLSSLARRTELEKELDEKYPSRPHNHSTSLPFHSLLQDLFDPLNENKKKPTGLIANRRRLGPDAGLSQNPHERRRKIIERFISRWRREVGDDIYPAFRLIVPDKDRERAMYGLKEKALGNLLVKIMKIDKNSEDGYNLLHWKLPGQNSASRMAGDFAGRCYEVISKRPLRTDVGDMTIDEVNERLDLLSIAPRDEQQMPILTEFYKRMNAEELIWLIRIILRQMKVGASEKTFFEIWHPDADALFNVSSSLRRVCWELYDVNVRLENEDCGVSLMQCFQPQLAQFQMHDFKKIVEKLRPIEGDREFWIEEKLDGERLQLHMMSDDSIPGGKRFKFWSRKAKEYTYLYGEGLHDRNGALTQFLKEGFREGVENVILDGEMITWDPEIGKMVAFGTLKTAALSEQKNPFANGHRPLFRVFDILLLNDRPLTRYTLRDRRKALEASIESVPDRFELHQYTIGTSADDIDPCLRQVVAQASEGLVLKNPRSAYKLNERNDDWMKVKPEYMTEFGESLDCLIIGGYYGSGRRGGGLSSFLCGLRVEESRLRKEGSSQKFISFFKVGGGMTAEDYGSIRHMTDGKWIDWDSKKPPTDYIQLAGVKPQTETPDMWIRPSDSVVVEVKAASVVPSDDYATGVTLRFPRFKRLRQDKNWQTALSREEFLDLEAIIEKEKKEKDFKIDDEKRKRRKLNPRKKILTVAGYTAKATNETHIEISSGQVFAGLTFYVMTESLSPAKKTKVELEELIKANGGRVVQTHTAVEHTICVAERKTVKVASVVKKGEIPILKPIWLTDCIDQAKTDFSHGLPELTVPVELDRHIYFMPEDMKERYVDNIDEWGDSYARDTSTEELREIMEKMETSMRNKTTRPTKSLLEDFYDNNLSDVPGWMFIGTRMYFHDHLHTKSSGNQDDNVQTNTLPSPSPSHSIPPDQEIRFNSAKLTASFAGAEISTDLSDTSITHIVVDNMPSSAQHHSSMTKSLEELRKEILSGSNSSNRRRIPRIVTCDWITQSWKEKTRLDEERFAP